MSPQKIFAAFLAIFSLGCTLQLGFQVHSAQSSTLRVVSSARFTSPVAPGSIASIFPVSGSLGADTGQATALPLPTEIAGTRVLVDGLPAPLFFVSSNQINFLVPESLAPGTHSIQVVGSSGDLVAGEFQAGQNPSIFTAPGLAIGWAAGVTTFDGKSFASTVDAALQAIPIDVGNFAAPNYLILFGTGLRGLPRPEVRIGVVECPITYAGAHPYLPGLDQINVQVRPELLGAGECFVQVAAGPYLANLSKVVIR